MEFTISDFLLLSELEELRLVAGRGGTDRVIASVNVIDNPDTIDWLMFGDLILSTGYIFQKDADFQRKIIRSMAEINCAGLCVKTGRYLQTSPDSMIAEANRLNLPVIELPFGYSLSSVISAVNRRLFSQSDPRLEKTLSIHREVMRVALASGGLNKLMESLAQLIGNPVLATDSSWNLLCCADRPDSPVPLERCISTELKSPPFPEKFFLDLPDNLNHYRKAVTRTIQTTDGLQIPCRILPIIAHGVIYGYLVVLEAVHSLTELDYVALEQVAIAAALERIRTKEVEQAKLRARRDFLDDLLLGNIKSMNAIQSLAKLHNLEFNRKYRCMSVLYDDRTDSEQTLISRDLLKRNIDRITAAVTRTAGEAAFNVVTVAKGGQLIVLVETGRFSEDRTPALRQMTELLSDRLQAGGDSGRIIIVVGKEVANAAEVSGSFRDTQNGINMIQNTQNRVIFMDDYAAYQLLRENISPEVLRKFRSSSIGALLHSDAENKTVFTETLDMYFHHNCSITEAAADMYVHRNTYIYRLEKIKALLGVDLKDPVKLLELQLGLLAHRILEE